MRRFGEPGVVVSLLLSMGWFFTIPYSWVTKSVCMRTSCGPGVHRSRFEWRHGVAARSRSRCKRSLKQLSLSWRWMKTVYPALCLRRVTTKEVLIPEGIEGRQIGPERIDKVSLHFYDRVEAGRLLAHELWRYAGRADVLVLALPRGGVPVGFQVASELRVPLDIFLVRKLGVPGHEELAMGAIASG